jgi:hypothetical protein
MDKTDILISLRRTVVPIIVGSIMGSWLGPNLEVESLTAVISGVVSSAYYLFWRVIETHVPGAGFFLGARKIPVYLDNAA